MADVTSRLRLVVDSTGVDKAGRKLKQLRQDARQVDIAARGVQRAILGIGAVLGASFSFGSLLKAVDSYRQIENQLRLVTKSAKELRSAQEGVLAVANRTGATYAATAGLYSNLRLFAGDFLKTQQQTLDFATAINQAALVSGASVADNERAVRQLSQAIAGGILRAEEFNSLVDNNQRLVQALADGLGVSMGELRRQVNAGLVSVERLIPALQSQFASLSKEADGAAKTIGQAFQVLGNTATDELGRRLKGVQDAGVAAILSIADNIDKLILGLQAATAGVAAFGAAVAAAFVASAVSNFLNLFLRVAAFSNAATAAMVILGDGVAKLRAGMIALNAVLLANPVIALATALGIATAAIVLFGDRLDGSRRQLLGFDAAVRKAFESAGVEMPDRLKEGLDKSKEDLERFEADYKRILASISEARKDLLRVEANPTGTLSNDLRNMREIVAVQTENIRLSREMAASLLVYREQFGNIPVGVLQTGEAPEAFRWLNEETAKFNVTAKAASFAAEALAEKERMLAEASREAAREAEQIAEQQKQVARIFSDLATEREALMAGSEREASIIRTTAELLRDQAAYYKSLGKDAQAMAKADAERIFDLKAQNAALAAQNSLTQNIVEQQELIRAAALGEREQRIAEEVLRIRRELGRELSDQEQAIAAQNVDLEYQLEIIQEQRRAIEAPFDNLANNLRDAIINGGKSGVGGLKGIFKSFINDLKTSFVESLFNPLSQAIRNIPNGFGVPIFGPGAGIGGGGVFGGAVSQSLIGTSVGQQAIAGGGAGLLPFLGLGGLVRNAQFGLAGLGVRSGSLLGLGGAGQALLGKAFAGGGTGFLVSQGVNALGSLFGLGNRGNTGASIGGTIGGIAGSIIPGIGTIVGSLIGSTLGKVFGSLFGGKPSDKIGQAVFNPVTGQIVGTGKKDNSQDALNNLNIAKAISEGVSDATGIIAKLIGSETAALINVAAGNRDGIRIGLQGSAGQIVNAQRFDNTEAGAQAAVEAGIKLALQNLQGGDDTLRKVAQSLAQSGKSVEDIANTLQTIADLTDLGSEPLSEWQQRIKDLNETFDDALASVKGITEAEQELTAARDKAIAKVTGDFNKQIQDDISQYLTGPTDQLERLLKAQQERFEEAKKLGADLGEVERLANLELRSFFEGLNEQALQEVQSFLGLFEEASASVARQLDLSRQDLQGQRDSFAQFAQDFAQLRTDLQERFVAASPRESLDILRARATDLLGQVGEGNASAAQALPQVLNNLVENARQSFGNTKQFQTVLDFATDIARQAEEAALGVVSDTERQIAAMDESNTLLADIRDILASSQAANAFFQSYSSGGIASSDELLKLIQEGAGLTPIANDNAAALNITSLMAQTMAPIIQPLANSIDAFTQRLSDMPNLMRLQIENDDRNTDRLVERLEDIYDVLDRTELLQKKQLEALDEAA